MRRLALSLLLCAIAFRVHAAEPIDEKQRREATQHYRKGDEALRSERFEDAEREFRKAVELDPLMTLGHYGLGQSYMALKRYPDAVKAFQGCRDAFQSIATLGATDQAEMDRRRDQEIAGLRDSIAILQRNSRLENQNQNNIRQMEDRVRDLERQRKAGGAALEMPAEVPFSLGSAYFRTGALADAEREYGSALKINPKLGEAHNNLAVVYLLTDRAEPARKEVEAAEKAGFKVNPRLKQDIEGKLKAASH
jgi:tetratricopeptide (TPR) repeat protein